MRVDDGKDKREKSARSNKKDGAKAKGDQDDHSMRDD